MTPRKSALLKTAIEAAEAAGAVLLRNFGKRHKISEKPGAGLVTAIDLEAESRAIARLRKHSKQFRFLTEETHPEFIEGKHEVADRWILDPLDGTTNFIHGFPMFCVSVAAEVEGELAVGVIYHPVLKEMVWAERGRGAYVGHDRIQVSKTAHLRDSLLTTGFTYRKNAWLKREMEAFEKLSQVSRAVRRPGSAALDLAYVARGVFDGFWERRLSPWDVAAGALIVEEAGGKVTNMVGGKFQIECREIVASNRKLHRPLLESIAD